MEQVIIENIEAIGFGEAQLYQDVALIPLFGTVNNATQYLTLKAALEKGLLVITEVSDRGSVPELLAKNSGDLPILLLDGEEVAGAKQNRVLNTTILLRGKSETVIPVSCTEQGRWHYRTDTFHDSEIIMARGVRANKARTVTDSLRREMSYRADQSQVWDDIVCMSRDAGVESETGAMRDVYQSREGSLNEYVRSFPLSKGQIGLLVFIGGNVAGFDAVSLDTAYADLHDKLVKSYAMDAAAAPGSSAIKGSDYLRLGRTFFKKILSCREEKYQSAGYGTDYRYEGNGSIGSALVADGKVLHMAFFMANAADRTGRMSSSRQRTANRARRPREK